MTVELQRGREKDCHRKLLIRHRALNALWATVYKYVYIDFYYLGVITDVRLASHNLSEEPSRLARTR